MSDVKIEIDRTTTDGTFTNHDIIKGSVTLVVTKAITLNWIQVKLEGISSTQLSIPKQLNNRKDRDKKEKLIKDDHKVLYDTQIVFPPDNVRQVSQAKDFTLAPGNYSYGFEFKIPLNNSCVKMGGITNKVSLNLKTFDVMINNGNFNSTFVKNKANQFINEYGVPLNGSNQKGSIKPPQNQQQHYHITSQLPPSLSGIGDFAKIKYFLKVTCKRSSFLKTNLRAYDPFIFLPLDLDMNNRPLLGNQEFEVDYREAFVRKELIFRNRIPEIVGVKFPTNSTRKTNEKKALPAVPNIAPKKQGLISRLFGSDSNVSSSLNTSNVYSQASHQIPHSSSEKPRKFIPEINAKDVPFSFEIRFRYPAFLIPTKPPSFKLFLISSLNPQRYSLAEYGKPDESNGLGIIYLQKLTITLTSTTLVSVVENDGASNEYHMGQHEERIDICNNTYQNLKFDLMHSQLNRNASSVSSNNLNSPTNSIYEIEIPRKYFDNCILPDHLSPSFKTCNITRKYNLNIKAGFSCEIIKDFRDKSELSKKIKYVDLQCVNIKVLSGLNITSTLHNNASRSSIPTLSQNSTSNNTPQLHTPPPTLPSKASERSYSHSSISPMNHSSPQNNGSSHNESNGHIQDHETNENSTNEPTAMLPTYEDVVLESSYQDNSEHQRARRRYQQHEQYYYNLE
ncbi:uncharacterized protein KGF55_004997 [Candida pseudojiufengensis]|uniref:uncharacterized protein n=1 Tax=Candida pseudojiufengensis TaxID=497109 RepID=UPI00222547A5|nr:uncharacterized protein KGF55_004997 [Candida pseudojiufengensis]KAI5959765.1 hypothetical protein KGF55_004997 [Candida pseudojiufengensis]